MRKVWKSARYTLGRVGDADFVVYILWHTSATRLARAGGSLGLINRWLGHKSLQMTMRLAKFATQDFQEAAKVLGEAAGLVLLSVTERSRACRHLSQTIAQTKCSPARKFRAVFS